VKKMPNENVLNQKKAKVAEIVELLKSGTAGVLVDYTGISVEDDTKLRKELREAGVKYFVEKNTLLRRAMDEVGLDALTEVLSGATAIAVSEHDETAAARILGKYAEDHENFKLKAGFIGSETYDEAGVKAISKIPSKETLLAQLVGSLQGPMQKLAATIAAVAEKKEGEAA
jgi:large subunit ribosomal protein L10